MKPSLTFTIGALLLSLLVSACGGAAPEESFISEPEVSVPEPANTHPPSTPEISELEQESVDSTNPMPRELAEKAKEDLAQRLSIPLTQIDLVEAKKVVWTDASLGCPQPGIVYAQVLTPGFFVQLEAQGQEYEYHIDMDQIVILCDFPVEEIGSLRDTEKNIEDGWPNQTKDKDVIIVTPPPRK